MSEKSNEYDLRNDVSVSPPVLLNKAEFCDNKQGACDYHVQQEIKKCNPETRLCPFGRQGKETERLHGVANVYIVDYDIKRGRESL